MTQVTEEATKDLSGAAYAELHCLSGFSFGYGASLPEELVERAHALGYSALAITDEATVAGLVRAHEKARQVGLRLLPGASFKVAYGQSHFAVLVLARDGQAWGDLCAFITRARRSAPKGQYRVRWPDPAWARLRACEVLLVLPLDISLEASLGLVRAARQLWAEHVWLGVHQHLRVQDKAQLLKLQQLGALSGVSLVACGGVLMHVRARKPLHDVLSAVRLGRPVRDCGQDLQVNAEAHLRARARLQQLYPSDLLANTLVVAQRCQFNLDELRYQYPLETLLPGQTPAQTLRHHTFEGARQRYPQGLPQAVRQQIEHELALISELSYEMYFLTVHDVVAFARSRGILCQGRGSAANSAVCYCLGVTEVDPARSSVLFERFISRERDEPPDIDVDFEHQRREEVIQYLYAKYGRDRAALAAVVIRYRPRSALRDVGRALGLDEAVIRAMAKEHPGMYSRKILQERLHAALERLASDVPKPSERTLAQWLTLSHQLMGFPRHLSQHPGGFVLTRGLLHRLVPIENAAMPERSVIQWDKDDLDTMGLLKVDVLALGMLSAIRRCLALVGARRGSVFRMQDIPADDVATFDMVCAADTVGVFQIESRAQMSMLPRLRPRCFYDLVVEVAIVRPGPIQGGMVHPYLKARANAQAVHYASPALKSVLERTLGVPIFQEQVMQVAMAAADFSPGEADQLRRSMAAWKRQGGVHKFYDRLVSGMLANGYTTEFAEQLFRQIEGFGEYGFPESHAASFALLVWASAWLKCHEPACFLAAMVNSQPMGFYAPSQLVQDAQRHGVAVLPADVAASEWDCTLEGDAVRLGLRLVSGLSESAAQRLVQVRQSHAFESVQELALRADLDRGDLKALASADALQSLAGHRRQQVWESSALQRAPALLRQAPVREPKLTLSGASESEEVCWDYASTGLSLRSHPLRLLREQLSAMRLMTASHLHGLPNTRLVRAAGLVVMRQSPQTAKGVTFITLEDETGSVNVIVWKSVRERYRSVLLHARLLAVHGVWQRDEESSGQVCHVVAGFMRDLTPLLGDLMTQSRDFH